MAELLMGAVHEVRWGGKKANLLRHSCLRLGAVAPLSISLPWRVVDRPQPAGAGAPCSSLKASCTQGARTVADSELSGWELPCWGYQALPRAL